ANVKSQREPGHIPDKLEHWRFWIDARDGEFQRDRHGHERGGYIDQLSVEYRGELEAQPVRGPDSRNQPAADLLAAWTAGGSGDRVGGGVFGDQPVSVREVGGDERQRDALGGKAVPAKQRGDGNDAGNEQRNRGRDGIQLLEGVRR